jgi:hypothetical protein
VSDGPTYTGDDRHGRTVLTHRGLLPEWLERYNLYPFIERFAENVQAALMARVAENKLEVDTAIAGKANIQYVDQQDAAHETSVAERLALKANSSSLALKADKTDSRFVVGTSKHVYVSPTGSDAETGLTPAHAFATIAKAKQTIGNSGTIELLDGTYTITSTLDFDVLHSLKGQGSTRTTILVDFDGVGISWKPTVFSGRAAGTFEGFALLPGPNAGPNTSGFRLSTLVKAKQTDLRVENFNGVNGIGFWYVNEVIQGNAFWTERLNVRDCVAANNTVNVCFDVNAGTNSFMYAENINITINANAVEPGQPAQTGFLIRNRASLLGCNINFMGNIAGVSGTKTVPATFIRITGTNSDIVNSSVSIRGEMTSGTLGTSIRIDAGARMLSNTGVIAFVNTTGFEPLFETGSIFGHNGTVAGNGFGTSHPAGNRSYFHSVYREVGAALGIILNRTVVSAASPLWSLISHPAGHADGDLLVQSYDGTRLDSYHRYRYTASGPQNISLAPFITRFGGGYTPAVKGVVNGTATQMSGAGDKHYTIPFTYNPTASADATVLVEISPDNVTYTALGTYKRPMGSTAGVVELNNFEVPHGWWIRFTATNVTLGSGIAY